MKLAFLVVNKLKISFDLKDSSNEVVSEASFKADIGEVIVILGASGSGKSSILSAIANYITYEGNIDIKDDCQPAFVFQDSYMVDFLSARENVVLPQILKGQKKDERKVEEILKLLELNELDKSVFEISGGERERIGIARSLASFSPLILMDEPTGSLDSKTGLKVEKLINKIKSNHLIILATHDRDMAFRIGDKVYEIENKKLKIIHEKKNAKTMTYASKKEEVGTISLRYSLLMGLRMLKKKSLKTFLSSFILSISLCFVLLIVSVCLNSNLALTKMTDEYFGKNLSSISLVERIKIDNGFDLVRSIRPRRETLEEYNLEILPSFGGVITGSLNLETDNSKVDVLFSPSTCNQSKLKSGWCPKNYNEVIVNESYFDCKIISPIYYSHHLTIESRANKHIASDKLMIEIDCKIVGVSRESKTFNIPSIYYDYNKMSHYLSNIILTNASDIFGKVVTLYDRIDYISTDTENLSGYAYLILDDKPDRLRDLFREEYEIDNRALDMKKATSELVESMGMVAIMFLMMAVSSAVMLEFITILSVYEEERKTFALYKSLGMSHLGFKKLSQSVAIILASFVSALTVGIFLAIQTLSFILLKPFGISSFLESTYLAYKIIIVVITNVILGLLISGISLRKVVNNDLMNSLKGE